MKNIGFYLVVVILLNACTGSNQDEKAPTTTDSIKARFTVDYAMQQVDTLLLDAIDTAFVIKNKPIVDDMGDKQKDYIINIYFSNKKWPVLTFKNAIGADLALAGDLDGDTQPELLLRPEWFSSCWASINLFSLKNNTWNLVKDGSMYFCADEYPLSKRVVKTDAGYGLLTDSLTDDKFITLKKAIKF